MSIPIDFRSFKNNQIILNSDRLLFNSKSDSIYLISNNTIGLSSNDSIHFNIGTRNKGLFVVNSNKIQLGLSLSGNSLEPITKADTMEKIINDLLNALDIFSKTLSSANGTGSGLVGLMSVNIAANSLNQKLKTIKNKVVNIKSKTSYTI